MRQAHRVPKGTVTSFIRKFKEGFTNRFTLKQLDLGREVDVC